MCGRTCLYVEIRKTQLRLKNENISFALGPWIQTRCYVRANTRAKVLRMKKTKRIIKLQNGDQSSIWDANISRPTI